MKVGELLGTINDVPINSSTNGLVVETLNNIIIILNYDNLMINTQINSSVFHELDLRDTNMQFMLVLSESKSVTLSLNSIDYIGGYVNDKIAFTFNLVDSKEPILPNTRGSVKIIYGEKEAYAVDASAFVENGQVLEYKNVYYKLIIKRKEVNKVFFDEINILVIEQYENFVIINYEGIADWDELYYL